MKELRISKDLTLPLEWMTLATVVYGARGSGKTCLGRVLAEETHRAGQRFCAIDLKGDWWGLKASADGKSDGIPVVVFGGDHADLPLEENAGAEVARLVAELEQSTILDFEHLSKGKQLRFQAQFFATLYDVNRNPLVLLGDEAQRYATQKPIDPDAAKCLGAVEDLVKLGRKHGIAPVLFTQRGSGLNKEVSELCDLLVAFRTPGPLDQKRVEDWLGANTTEDQAEEVMSKIAGLATGTAVFASGHPDLKLFGVHKVRMPTTFDSSATPKIGERRKEPTKLAKPDLDAIRAKMTAAIERAKADDPKALRARIAELEKAARVGHRDAKPEKVVERVEVTVFDREKFGELHREIHERISAAEAKVNDVKTECGKLLVDYRKAREAEAKAPMRIISAPPPRTVMPRSADERSQIRVDGGAKLGNTGMRRMLVALAQHRDGLTRSQLSILTGIAKTGGTFTTYLPRLVKEGWAAQHGERYQITSEGLETLGAYEELPKGADLLNWWCNELGGGMARMLRVLDAQTAAITREELAELTGIERTGGTFTTYLPKLKNLELVVEDGEGLELSEELR